MGIKNPIFQWTLSSGILAAIISLFSLFVAVFLWVVFSQESSSSATFALFSQVLQRAQGIFFALLFLELLFTGYVLYKLKNSGYRENIWPLVIYFWWETLISLSVVGLFLPRIFFLIFCVMLVSLIVNDFNRLSGKVLGKIKFRNVVVGFRFPDHEVAKNFWLFSLVIYMGSIVGYLYLMKTFQGQGIVWRHYSYHGIILGALGLFIIGVIIGMMVWTEGEKKL